MKRFFTLWIEQYLFFPNLFQRLISIAFFPLTILYCIVVAYKRISAHPIDFDINIISIGNLIVGGSGKTPVTIALAKEKEDAFVILRGYGRTSKGMIVVSQKGKILVDSEQSGDEAMVLARSLPNGSVIVAENRIEGILKAKELGAKIIFLDDGYRHHNIKKFDILIRPNEEPTNLFCLPSGGYRETKMMYAFVPVVLRDGEDFKRIVTLKKMGRFWKLCQKISSFSPLSQNQHDFWSFCQQELKWKFSLTIIIL
jgi:tetraacyldisaccharide 4'-kinase